MNRNVLVTQVSIFGEHGGDRLQIFVGVVVQVGLKKFGVGHGLS